MSSESLAAPVENAACAGGSNDARWRSLLICFMLAAALIGLTATWLFGARRPLGRDNWFIVPHPFAWPVAVWLLPLAVLAVFGGLAALSAYDRFHRAKTRHEQKVSITLCLVALSLLALAWPWSLMGPTPQATSGASNLIEATWSDVANGYFSTAYEIEDVRDFTRHYTTRHQRNYTATQAHVATHPPGATLFYWLARRAFEAAPPLQNLFAVWTRNLTGQPVAESAAQTRTVVERGTGVRPALPDSAAACALWCAFLLSLAVAATVPAVYLLATNSGVRDAGDADGGNDASNSIPNPEPGTRNPDEARGLLAAALFALAPAIGLFAFTLDALVACLAAWALVFLARRVRGGAAWWMFAAGTMLALSSFLSFGALALWAVVLLALALQFGARSLLMMPSLLLSDMLSRRRPAVHRPASDIALCALGFGALWLLLVLIFPMQPLAIFDNAMEAHRQATLQSRSHAGWAWLNLVVFALFCGWPLVTLGSVRLLRRWRTRWRGRDIIIWETPEILGVATLVTLLLLTLSGNVRGEVERLWLFALPPLCAFAASALQKEKEKGGKSTTAFGIALLPFFFCVLQALQTLMMASALAPLVRPF